MLTSFGKNYLVNARTECERSYGLGLAPIPGFSTRKAYCWSNCQSNFINTAILGNVDVQNIEELYCRFLVRAFKR